MMNEDFEAYQRLQRLYADMSDNKLLEMAENIDDLTDIAQNALKEEISKRGLEKHLPEQETAAVPANQNGLVGVHYATNPEEAQQVADVLETEGIQSVVTTERIEYVDGTAEDKPVVKVVYLERDHALYVLKKAFPAENDETADQYAVCPKCQSQDIVLQGLDSRESNASKYNWSCDACGHQWSDDGIAQLKDARAE
jgi:DNA-directed RNA polymerase subunit M/transcription elongation factor TFIIS